MPCGIFTGKIVLIVLLFLEEMSTGFNILKKIKAAPTDPSLKSDWSFQASSNPNLTVILTPCSPGRWKARRHLLLTSWEERNNILPDTTDSHRCSL